MNTIERLFVWFFCVVVFDFDFVEVANRGRSIGSGSTQLCSCSEVCRATGVSTSAMTRSGWERFNGWGKFGCAAKEGAHCDCSDCTCVTKPMDFGVNYLCNSEHCPIGKCGCATQRSCANYTRNPNDCPCVDENGEGKCSRCDRIWCDDRACVCKISGVAGSFAPKLSGKCPQVSRGGKLYTGGHSFCKPNGQ